MKTGFYTNPIYLRHDTGAHPENANRLKAIHEKLESEGLMEICLERIKVGNHNYTTIVRIPHVTISTHHVLVFSKFLLNVFFMQKGHCPGLRNIHH